MAKIKQNSSEGKSKNEKLTNGLVNDRYWVRWGLKLMDDHRFSDALTSFDRALEINPFNIDALHQKGKCLIWLNNYNQGIKCFDLAMHLKNVELAQKEIKTGFIHENNIKPDEDFNLKLNDIDLNNKSFDYLNSDIYKSKQIFENKPKSNVKNVFSKSIGIDLRNKLNNDYNLEQKKDTISKHSNYIADLFADEQKGNHIYRYTLDKNVDKTYLNPFDLSSKRYKIINSDINISPKEGGLQSIKKTFLEELIEFQRAEIDYAINCMMNQHGGSFYYHIESQYLFKISLLLLEMAIDVYHMDGVIITIDKPAKYIKKVLENSCESDYEPFYIDCNINGWERNGYDQVTCDEFITKNNITYLQNNFNFIGLRDAIEMNLQKVVELYEGENHFIFFDNISAFQDFVTVREIKKFITSFAKDLRKLNLFGFFMVPKGTINVSLRDSLQNLPNTISNKLSFWDRSI